eukprot:TRINITY_DN73383_c0_g1_i1.p1 TRINITY_DN73383_c0_g1~~TRINITY_DN73383_c0_g1_i1.p1  ORF type:complete len:214 (+),score=45.67 TRINITY_DN73383_c0_g1_i1:81-722(+)
MSRSPHTWTLLLVFLPTFCLAATAPATAAVAAAPAGHEVGDGRPHHTRRAAQHRPRSWNLRRSHYQDWAHRGAALTAADAARARADEARVFENGRKLRARKAAFRKRLARCGADLSCRKRITLDAVKDEKRIARGLPPMEVSEQDNKDTVHDGLGRPLPLLWSGDSGAARVKRLWEESALGRLEHAAITVRDDAVAVARGVRRAESSVESWFR